MPKAAYKFMRRVEASGDQYLVKTSTGAVLFRVDFRNQHGDRTLKSHLDEMVEAFNQQREGDQRIDRAAAAILDLKDDYERRSKIPVYSETLREACRVRASALGEALYELQRS